MIVVHTPIHASWLNQAEIYFSIVQRKALQPNDFEDLDALERHLLAFGRHYEQIARPFEWKFTRRDLDRLLHRLDQTPERRLELRAARLRRTSIRRTSKNLRGQRASHRQASRPYAA